MIERRGGDYFSDARSFPLIMINLSSAKTKTMKVKPLLALTLFSLILQSCTLVYRGIHYGDADIDDSKVFVNYELSKSSNPFSFKQADSTLFDRIIASSKDTLVKRLKDTLTKTTTRAFLVIRNDTILFEHYYRGYKRSDISTFFSVSKSVTSLLVGIAVDEGYISSIDDPVTKYVKELNSADPKFQKLTIRDLLSMRSGLKFDENYSNPFKGMARLYYGTNQLGQIRRMKFECDPGTKHEYQSVSTALMGIVLEKATGMTLAHYFKEKVWSPLRMENSASWSLDDRRHRSTKAYCGLNATAIDLAKIGRLYLNHGRFDGRQIVSESWVQKTFTPDTANSGYQFQWYSITDFVIDSLGHIMFFPDSLSALSFKHSKLSNSYSLFSISNRSGRWYIERFTNQFFACGIMQQFLFIDPSKNLIIVRLGDNGDIDYLPLMCHLANVL